MKEPKLYTLGFFFSVDNQRVALIRKTKPAWQAGRLNGIGGKVEYMESPIQCMIREFREETGHIHVEWELFAKMQNSEFKVFCFVGFGDVDALKTTTEEEVVVIHVEDVRKYNTISNVRWLIPIALDDEMEVVEFNYKPQDKYVEPVTQAVDGSN
jgi:8-oxo-dGTP diphosphatase